MEKMITREDFIKKTINLIRKKIQKELPNEATLEEMIDKFKREIKNMY